MGTLRIVGGEISGKEIEPSESLQNVRGCLPKVALQHEPIAQGSPPGSCRASPSGRTITKIKLRRQLLLNVTILLDGSVVSVVQKVFVEEIAAAGSRQVSGQSSPLRSTLLLVGLLTSDQPIQFRRTVTCILGGPQFPISNLVFIRRM